jgi:hypothetical protein
MPKIKIGDIFEIYLSDGRMAYGQYVYQDKTMGPLIQVFDKISRTKLSIDDLRDAHPLFPTVITGLFAAIRDGVWTVVGNTPVNQFKYPGFLKNLFDSKTGKARTWFLWNGMTSMPLGSTLSTDQKKLEFLVIWNPSDIVERIEAGGARPYPFEDLIERNQFKPLQSEDGKS